MTSLALRSSLLLVSVAMMAVLALAQGRAKSFRTQLSGYEEVPTISTSGGGEFRAKINNAETEISWEMTYSNLEGDVSQAHIHLGRPATNGGIVIFLCTNLGNGPVGTQLCPPAPATIGGTFSASDMVGGAVDQGLLAGEFDELIRAIRSGSAYVNVHSDLFPMGEVRGQLAPGKGHQH